MIGRRDLELIIVCGKETKQKNDFYCKISGHLNRDIFTRDYDTHGNPTFGANLMK